MKFAKTLAAQLHAPWHDSYFPYKQLKKQLGALKGGGRSKFAGVEGAFYASVVHSIQMVDEFYGVHESFSVIAIVFYGLFVVRILFDQLPKYFNITSRS